MTLFIFCVMNFSFLNVFGKNMKIVLVINMAKNVKVSGKFRILLFMNKIPEIINANADAVTKIMR